LPQVSRCVVVIAPPPVDEARWDNRTLARAGEYGEAARKVAAAAAADASVPGPDGGPPTPVLFVSALDLFTATAAAGSYDGPAPPGPLAPGAPSWHALLSDGLHLSPAGNQVLARA
jgi:lysophospholipase L1-like esterase